ncbi:hypothetical protein RAH57_02705 [Chryseobacterium sp. CKR4-1]|uniref:hypothetical protein n=1 Tax=Chryseobacterium sp. CKR4-1 TaxID=3068896 RepID=UPI00279699A0|nr:hypothetical protein [Chryseobacterium sp. CKR4-1]MDQ1802881.1 hypothetical protein [Chryseobacterium sp. CKR4-1]
MNRKVLFIIVYTYALVFSVLKTIRFPNQWSVAHWMLDYRFGFIKRGFAGGFLGLFVEKNEQNIFVLSVFIILLLYGLLLFMASKETIRNKGDVYTLVFYLTFFLSQYIIFTAHLIGYLDHIIFLLTILVIWLLRKKKILLASLVASISILIHEVSFFLMLPICCFALVVDGVSGERISFKDTLNSHLIKRISFFLILPLAVTFGVSAYQEMSGSNYHKMIFNYLDHLEFINAKVADSVASAYTVKFTDYIQDESPHFFQRVFVSKCSIFFGIPILFMMYVVYRKFEKANKYLLLLFAIVILIPLGLHAIAYDTYRIWSFPFMILFLGYWILSSGYNVSVDVSEKLSLPEILLAALAIALVSLVPSQLLDDEVERFSLVQRLLILIPLLALGTACFYKKAPM